MMSALPKERVALCLQQLPPLPQVVSELLASFAREDDVDVERLAHQISRDQAITARVLRVANSSFYGLQSRVATIPDAVVVLGFRAVRSLVLAVGVNYAFLPTAVGGLMPRPIGGMASEPDWWRQACPKWRAVTVSLPLRRVSCTTSGNLPWRLIFRWSTPRCLITGRARIVPLWPPSAT